MASLKLDERKDIWLTFRDAEKERYKRIKRKIFSPGGCRPGTFMNIERDFCLSDENPVENLHVSVRVEAIKYFRDRRIPWHNGFPDGEGNPTGHPSNHLCCSQCACVNTLWPMTENPDLLASVFRPFFPELDEVLPFEADLPLPDRSIPYLAFEWTGTRNYLNETSWGLRGALSTSTDFAFRFRRFDGKIQMVLGEWKYTESYNRKLPPEGEINRTRLRIYRDAFERWKNGQSGHPPYYSFFVEPFYQLMRLSLLAHEMENARLNGEGEMNADIVTIVLVVPKANEEYKQSVTSPELAKYGRDVVEIWRSIAPPDRFVPIWTENLMSLIGKLAPDDLQPWRDYLMKRYGWWRESITEAQTRAA